ncbi:MAG: DNA adenine methylase [Myxococcales bacterium]|nr:DNA adenine methylase [Myxococcales bacterium]
MSEQLLTYIGNKRALLPFIGQGVEQVRQALGKDKLDVFDAFAGSGAVARYLKQYSSALTVCDLEQYAAVVNTCYLANRRDVELTTVARLIAHIDAEADRRPRPGLIASLYAPQSDDAIQPGERAFYTRHNAVKIDTIRMLIDEVVPEDLKPFVLAPLLYKASVHTNTSGVFKGFYKNSETGVGQFGGNSRSALSRICKPIVLPVPVLSRFESDVTVLCGDANETARSLPKVDLAYLDPPYNQHPYGSNYFMLNVIAANETPEKMSRVSGIPADWNRSAYNKRHKAKAALWDLVTHLNARFILVSFNSEGLISRQEMTDMLAKVGKTSVLEQRYNTFRGSRNLSGRDIHVTEFLFLVDTRG